MGASHPSRGLRRRLVALVLAGFVGAALHVGVASAGQNLFVGADEDNILWGNSQQTASIARMLGLRALHITVPWHPGQTSVPATYEAQLDRATVDAWGLRLVVSIYGRADEAPQTDDARSEYCSFVADLLKQHPTINDVVIWNDPNDAAFWSPQYDSAGASAAPAAYEALLARCWDVLHEARTGANVIALSASSQGALSLGSHAPAAWWRAVGDAYHSSGRSEPIFDTVGHIPHPENSAERPWAQHGVAGPIGEGDYGELVSALSDAFTGTAQPLPGEGPTTIWYLADGFQTVPDQGKASLYTGNETDPAPVPAWSANEASDSREGPAPDQAVQIADALAVAYCQPAVGAFFNFHLVDETDLAGWQSGVFWPDWTPKASYWSLKHEIGLIRSQSIDCSAFSQTGAPPAPTPTPAPGPALQISGVKASSISAVAATIDWKTSIPTATRVGFGFAGTGPTVWTSNPSPTLDHEVTLPGLSYSTTYRVWIAATSDDGQRAQSVLDVTTAGAPHSPNVSVTRTGGGTLLVDGQPFFPEIVWAQCPGGYGADLAAGINLFASNPCGGLQQQLDALGGRGLSTAVTGEQGGSGPGVIGFFWPDEADGLGMTANDLPSPLAGVAFLTLTNHFYSGAAPLPVGRGMYPGLIAKSDVVGFDLYPLQEWCKPDRMADVYLSQRELVKLAPQKPTFQWIEVANWNDGCPSKVTPATVNAESWLAIAGGARGLGFFPATWTQPIGQAIAGVSREISLLGPALMAPAVPSSAKADNSLVKVGARNYKGALYIIAVNAGFTATKATIGAAGLGGRTLDVLDEGRRVAVTGGSFTDSFAPLAVHIYIAQPPES